MTNSLLNSWDITVSNYGLITLTNQTGYRITFYLDKPPKHLNLYQGYKVYLPYESFDTFRSLSLEVVMNYVSYSESQGIDF
jgi:hypothetical protein